MDCIYINPGDHIFYSCGTHSHHGIYCGDISYKNIFYEDTVIHFEGKYKGGKIRGVSYQRFSKYQEVCIVQYKAGSCYAPDMVVQRAVSRLGEPNYDLFGNNCEHFAHWCKTGKKTSGQINDAIEMVGGLGGGILAGLAVEALLPLVIPELIVFGMCAAVGYAGGKVVGEFTTGLFTEPTDYETAQYAVISELGNRKIAQIYAHSISPPHLLLTEKY